MVFICKHNTYMYFKKWNSTCERAVKCLQYNKHIKQPVRFIFSLRDMCPTAHCPPTPVWTCAAHSRAGTAGRLFAIIPGIPFTSTILCLCSSFPSLTSLSVSWFTSFFWWDSFPEASFKRKNGRLIYFLTVL